MKTENIYKIFGNDLAAHLLHRASSERIAKKDVIDNLVDCPKRERTRRIEQFMERLHAWETEKHRKGLFRTFERRISKSDLTEKSRRLCDLFRKGRAFPNEHIPVAQFAAYAQDQGLMRGLMRRIVKRTADIENETAHKHADKDENAARRPRSKSYPYDFNRVGREQGVYLNASDVRLSDGQEYVLGSCPFDRAYMKDLFDALIQRNTAVMVSLHQKEETAIESTFWKHKLLSSLDLKGGWKIGHEKEKKRVLFESKDHPEAKIVERTFRLTKGALTRTIKHLHYEGWNDGDKAPCEALLIQLAQRIDEIGGPIWMNCKGGNGRTGQMALLHWGKRKIDKALSEGIAKDKIALNLPEMLAELRAERRKTISKAIQLAQVYSTLHRYLEAKSH